MEFLFSQRKYLGPGIRFSKRPGLKTSFIRIDRLNAGRAPDGVLLDPHEWARQVLRTSSNGHVLVVVHGFRVSQDRFLTQLRKLRRTCQNAGYKGAIVGFDWPANGAFLDYDKDIADARTTAKFLISSGIAAILRQQPTAKIHLIGHSMGAFVIARAIGMGLNSELRSQVRNRIGQIVFTAGDLDQVNTKPNGAFETNMRHLRARLTNYRSMHDQALLFPERNFFPGTLRVGRSGLAHPATDKLNDVDCTDYYARRFPGNLDPFNSHNWFYDTPHFYGDLLGVLAGRAKGSIGRRQPGPDNHQLFRT